MATLLPQKRSLSPSDANIPPEDCTRATFDQYANLSDRRFLQWALQTEARVRFARLEGRTSDDSDGSNGYDKTLDSEYLIDIYPDTGEAQDDNGILAPERHAFCRKCIPYLQHARDPDSSFETLTRLEIRRPQTKELKEMPKWGPVPPNLLFFEILLEAYMGYRVPSFRSEDPAQPSATIMGGAVVAALTSWRDEQVHSIFATNMESFAAALESRNVEEYVAIKDVGNRFLHVYFLHNHKVVGMDSNSPFSLGDVNIFLQASPLTRSLMEKLEELPKEVRDIVGTNLGGCGFVHKDLHLFAQKVCDEHLLPLFKDTGNDGYYSRWSRNESSFCYALAMNGLLFATIVISKNRKTPGRVRRNSLC